MASPQTENGFTKLANELLEHLSTVQMSGSEWQYVMCIIRKTYGYQKKEDWITNSQVVIATGLKKRESIRGKKQIISKENSYGKP